MPIIESLLFPRVSLKPERIASALSSTTILITGASFGIGEQLAYLVAHSNVHIILTARTEAKLHDIKTQLEARGARITIFATDLSQTDNVAKLIEDIHTITDGLDYLINNAGKSIKRPIMESCDRLHDFTRTMALNYFAPVQLILGLIPLLARHSGHIINVSAINVLLAPMPHWAAYQASKSSFNQWFLCASPELNLQDIHTSSVYLPLVKTRMLVPNTLYQKLPAMTAEHAAKVIINIMLSKKRRFVPWWLFGGQLISVIFRPIIERCLPIILKMSSYHSKKHNRKGSS